MRFSLVMATVGRTEELSRFLSSLAAQTYREFELVVVDQNPDDRLTPILQPFRGLFAITPVRSQPGLSRARNVGLRSATGDIVGFPDDDCWYPRALLETVLEVFLRSRSGLAGVTGRLVDEQGNDCMLSWQRQATRVSPRNAMRTVASSALFLRSSAVQAVGPCAFDERLGVGAGTLWGSGEETDLILRLISHGYEIEYNPEVVVCHPRPDRSWDSEYLARAYKYAAGVGGLLRKHRYPIPFVAYYHVLRPMAGALLGLLRGDRRTARYYWVTLCGRLRGYRAWQSTANETVVHVP